MNATASDTLDLDALVQQAAESFGQAATPADLENAKARFLGKSGHVTALMKGLAQLSVDEKKTRGAAINVAKQAIEAALTARRQALAQYVERVGRADAEATLLLYSGECDVEDPVGTPVHRGRAAVETFYRGGLSAITRTSPLSAAVVSGNVGAIAFRVELALPDRAIAIEVIDVMTFDDDHLFTSMRAFWGRVNRLAR